MKNRLTQLLLNLPTNKKYVDGICVGEQLHSAETIADYLLSEGVVVPPVKVGQTLYGVLPPIFEDDPEDGEIYEWTVKGIGYEGDGKWWIESEDNEWYELGDTLCKLTREEALQALKEAVAE
jgi:hypothetical protein